MVDDEYNDMSLVDLLIAHEKNWRGLPVTQGEYNRSAEALRRWKQNPKQYEDKWAANDRTRR